MFVVSAAGSSGLATPPLERLLASPQLLRPVSKLEAQAWLDWSDDSVEKAEEAQLLRRRQQALERRRGEGAGARSREESSEHSAECWRPLETAMRRDEEEQLRRS